MVHVGGLAPVPGLLAAGIGTLIFVGLDSLTGFGTFSLSIAGLPPFSHPNGVMFLWGACLRAWGSVLGTGIGSLGSSSRLIVERRMLVTETVPPSD